MSDEVGQALGPNEMLLGDFIDKLSKMNKLSPNKETVTVSKVLVKTADRQLISHGPVDGIEYVEKVTIELVRRPATIAELEKALDGFNRMMNNFER